MIVADATLLIHLTVPSATPRDAEAARAVAQKDPVWVVPPLWASEVRNVVAKYARGWFITHEQARAAVREIEAFVAVQPVSHGEVLDAAFAFEVSGYDAEYVALAERLDVPLVTSDKRVLAAVARAVAPVGFRA